MSEQLAQRNFVILQPFSHEIYILTIALPFPLLSPSVLSISFH